MDLNVNGVSKWVYPFNNITRNIEALFSTDGSNVKLSEYEYTPFGETVIQIGALSYHNPLRYNSQYTESNIGLVYYGYRHYSPSQRKWLSKDPIGEEGGVNLYLMAFNTPNFVFDVNGLEPFEIMIFVGHGSFLHAGINAIAKNYVEGAKNSLGQTPKTLKVTGVGCFDAFMSNYVGDFKMNDPYDTHMPRRVSRMGSALEQKKAAARKRAKEKCKEPDCCKSVRIRVEIDSTPKEGIMAIFGDNWPDEAKKLIKKSGNSWNDPEIVSCP